jgi:murein endopeptidase
MNHRTRAVLTAALLLATPAGATPSVVDGLAPQTQDGWTTPLWRAVHGPDEAMMEARFEAELAAVQQAEDAEDGALDDGPLDDDATPIVDPSKPPAVSIGSPNGGWLVYPARLQDHPHIKSRARSNYGTDETVRAIAAAVDAVQRRHPGGHPLVVGDISRRQGGPFRPHKSHQSGRDADIGYYFREGAPAGLKRATPRTLDVARTWTFLESLLADDKVEYVFTDRRLERALYHYAKDEAKVPAEVLDRIFSYPSGNKTGILRHLRGHADHLHVRFRSPQAVAAATDYVREHGLAAIKPLPVYRKVRRGDTLTALARRHKKSIDELCRWNRISRKKVLQPGMKLIVGHRRPRLPEPDAT